MIANMIGRAVLPETSVSDEVFSRLYYVASSGVDTAQTVVKIARSIFASCLSLLFLGQSKLLNKATLLSWRDVGFSIQLTAYSLLGILSPKQAWTKKLEAHIENATRDPGLTLEDFSESERSGLKALGLRLFLISQIMESGIRCGTAGLRFLTAKLMYGMSLENAKFVELLGQGAYQSAELAAQEVKFLSHLTFSSSND